jgi:hypothetical protein
MPRSTVLEGLKRAASAGLSWPLPDGMNDDALERALYANRRSKRGHGELGCEAQARHSPRTPAFTATRGCDDAADGCRRRAAVCDKAKVESVVLIVKTLATRQTAPPDLLQPGGGQRGDRAAPQAADSTRCRLFSAV